MEKAIRNTLIVIGSIILLIIVFGNLLYSEFGINTLKKQSKDNYYREITGSNISFNKELVDINNSFNEIEEIEILSEIRKLEVTNPIGYINIDRNNLDDKVKVEIIKSIESEARSIKEKENILKDIYIEVKEDKDTLIIDYDFARVEDVLKDSDIINISYNILLPKDLKEIELVQYYGNTFIKDFTGDTRLENNMGDVKLENLKGYFEINISLGKLEGDNLVSRGGRISNIDGMLSIIDLNLENPSGLNIQLLNGRLNIYSNKDKYNLMVSGKFKREESMNLPTINVNKGIFGKIKEYSR